MFHGPIKRALQRVHIRGFDVIDIKYRPLPATAAVLAASHRPSQACARSTANLVVVPDWAYAYPPYPYPDGTITAAWSESGDELT